MGYENGELHILSTDSQSDHIIYNKGIAIRKIVASWNFMTIVVSYSDKSVKVYDLRNNKLISKITHDNFVNNIATNGDLVATASNNTVFL